MNRRHFIKAKRRILVIIFMLTGIINLQAEYTETMNPNGLMKNLKSDYGLIDDNAKTNQSEIFQKAIDGLAGAGGGRLIVPKGTYCIAGVYLKSNVHLLIEKDTVIKPYWPQGEKTVVFILDAKRPSKTTPEQDKEFIENVSIRGLGGRFIVDYSERQRKEGESIRAVICRMVRNFLISGLDIKDNFTSHCGLTLTPTGSPDKDVPQWEVSRATDGTIRNCRIFNASPGYGLVQLHGAQSVHFEDIYAKGGVALRLETGAVGPQIAVYDITAKNITCENGRCAVMFGPHSAVNGVVKVDGVISKSCAYAVTMGKGGVKEAQLKLDPDATDGSFADGSYVKNIHVIFGKNAQIKTHVMLAIPEEYYDDLDLRWFNKFFEGPSIGAVKDTTEGLYHIKIENVTFEGFKYNTDKNILTPEDFRPGKWPDELRKWKERKGTDTTGK
ncbi:MAG: hypothetical protein KAR47_07690 [Planctomycetes bacterium]|nr:hypothetical protein [Planctomycetota bacterium]